MKKRNLHYFYPLYFDANRTRSQGRRLKKTQCISNPSLDKLAKAAGGLRVEFKIEADKAHPKTWWNSGRIAVPIKEKKQALLKRLAKKIRTVKK